MTHIKLYEEWCAVGSLDSSLVRLEEESTDFFDISWSDALHFIGDIASAAADIVVLGSGAAIDIVNALAYFVEAYFSKEDLYKTQCIVNGIIQCVATFAYGPLQAIPIIMKTQIKIVFDLFRDTAKATIQKVASARIAARAVTLGITSIKNEAKAFADTILAKLNSPALKTVKSWLSNKLGGLSVIKFITDFFTITIPTQLNKLLVMLAKLNPASVGAHQSEGELNELILKEVLKVGAKEGVLDKISAKISKLIDDFKTPTYTPNRIEQYQIDNPGRRTAGGLL